MNDEIFARVKRVATIALKLHCDTILHDLQYMRNNAEIDLLVDHRVREAVLKLRTFVLGKEVDLFHVRYPKDWWEAFKERWFPKWLIEKYPVRYEEINKVIYNCCPHLNVKSDKLHLEFLLHETPTRIP